MFANDCCIRVTVVIICMENCPHNFLHCIWSLDCRIGGHFRMIATDHWTNSLHLGDLWWLIEAIISVTIIKQQCSRAVCNIPDLRQFCTFFNILFVLCCYFTSLYPDSCVKSRWRALQYLPSTAGQSSHTWGNGAAENVSWKYHLEVIFFVCLFYLFIIFFIG